MSKENIKQFNDIINSFLIQCSPLVGTTYQYRYSQIIKCNALLPIEQFLINVLPLRDKILNRDETYFDNNEQELNKFTGPELSLNEIIKLRGIYSKMDQESKDNSWDILQALLILAEEYLINKKC